MATLFALVMAVVTAHSGVRVLMPAWATLPALAPPGTPVTSGLGTR